MVKWNIPVMMGLLFFAFILIAAIIILPHYFASMDATAESNAISETQYADEYNTGISFGKLFIMGLQILFFLDFAALVVMGVKGFV